MAPLFPYGTFGQQLPDIGETKLNVLIDGLVWFMNIN
jgi:hypothetical protein